MPTLDELYKTYGMQCIQLEILQGQIAQTKQAIANAINAQNTTAVPAAPVTDAAAAAEQ